MHLWVRVSASKHFYNCIFVFRRLEGSGLSSWPCLQDWIKADFSFYLHGLTWLQKPPQGTRLSRSGCQYVPGAERSGVLFWAAHVRPLAQSLPKFQRKNCVSAARAPRQGLECDSEVKTKGIITVQTQSFLFLYSFSSSLIYSTNILRFSVHFNLLNLLASQFPQL